MSHNLFVSGREMVGLGIFVRKIIFIGFHSIILYALASTYNGSRAMVSISTSSVIPNPSLSPKHQYTDVFTGAPKRTSAHRQSSLEIETCIIADDLPGFEVKRRNLIAVNV